MPANVSVLVSVLSYLLIIRFFIRCATFAAIVLPLLYCFRYAFCLLWKTAHSHLYVLCDGERCLSDDCVMGGGGGGVSSWASLAQFSAMYGSEQVYTGAFSTSFQTMRRYIPAGNASHVTIKLRCEFQRKINRWKIQHNTIQSNKYFKPCLSLICILT